MKKFMILLLFAFCSCIPKAEKNRETGEQNFDWLIGSWIRTNEKPDRNTFENWKKISSNKYQGSGFTIKDQDTIWQEDIILITTNDNWNFAVTAKGEIQQTVFKLTSISKDSFTSENQENEFPKIIRYKTDGDLLKAEIEGGDMKIPFEFKKLK